MVVKFFDEQKPVIMASLLHKENSFSTQGSEINQGDNLHAIFLLLLENMRKPLRSPIKGEALLKLW